MRMTGVRNVSPLLLQALAACTMLTSQAAADLESRILYSVEWLVDNSDVIAIVRHGEDAMPTDPIVLRTLKGTNKPLGKQLRYRKFDGNDFRSEPVNGHAAIIFVRGSSEVLSETVIARQVPEGYAPNLKDIYYGVTQFGKVLVSQAELIEAVESRVESGPSPLLMPRDKPGYSRSQNATDFNMYSLVGFALTVGEVEYGIRVSLSVERRDHYIKVLRKGNAAERISAVGYLLDFDDEQALQALREATECNDVTPAYMADRGYGALKALTADHVRKRAQRAVETGH